MSYFPEILDKFWAMLNEILPESIKTRNLFIFGVSIWSNTVFRPKFRKSAEYLDETDYSGVFSCRIFRK
jgi:hypothetical protein